MKTFTTSLLFLASASSVLGHATWQQLWVDGVDQAKTCVREPLSNSPVSDVTSKDIVCNAGTAAVAGICAINAGGEVTVEMHQHNTRDCSEEAIGGAHHGPVIIYMSKVDDATTADGTTGTWFKVAEDGYDAATGKWADDILNANCGKRTFTVPSDIATGDYLIRAEEIALHAAGSSGGAQFYMSCYQVHVQGTGSATPTGVSFPGAYSATDPGILINIYNGVDVYQIPGPDVYVSGGGAAAPAPAPVASSSAAAPVASATAVVPVASSSSAPVATSAPAAVETSAAPVASATSTAIASPIETSVASPVETAAPVTTPVDDEYEDCE
ncbi:glycosyl hydrolase family 61-domain-containing protein [Leptodontidium sp. 2 PMI_412]|nr:glycosyl hydrolase family 61-domain-containing protein [Leptodontidium sp. 2 PMI_412]